MTDFFNRILRDAEGGGGGGAAGATGGDTGKGAGGNTPAPWYTGLDNELVGHAQNKGWDKLEAGKAAQETLRSHRELEKSLGLPADRILRLPGKDAKPEDWTPVYERLGQPKDAKEYDFSAVKFADGSALDQGLADTIRAAAFANHLPKDAAAVLAKNIVAWADGIDRSTNAVNQAQVLEEKANLRESWGKYYDAQLVIARGVAEKFGFNADMVNALEGQAGYAAVMKGFAAIGSAIGEDNFIKNGSNKGGAITKEQAEARLIELKGDAAWTKSFLSGDVEKNKDFQALTKIAHGGA